MSQSRYDTVRVPPVRLKESVGPGKSKLFHSRIFTHNIILVFLCFLHKKRYILVSFLYVWCAPWTVLTRWVPQYACDQCKARQNPEARLAAAEAERKRRAAEEEAQKKETEEARHQSEEEARKKREAEETKR